MFSDEGPTLPLLWKIMKTLTREHSHLQQLKSFRRKQSICADERSIYIEVVLLLLVRETSAYHQLKNSAMKCKEIWEIQSCSISDCKATEATKRVCNQHLKLTLFLLFLFVSIIRLGNQTLSLVYSERYFPFVCVITHTHTQTHTQMQGV